MEKIEFGKQYLLRRGPALKNAWVPSWVRRIAWNFEATKMILNYNMSSQWMEDYGFKLAASKAEIMLNTKKSFRQ